MPHGGLFAYVSCANYLGELVQWGGWALATWSYAGLLWWLFALSTFVPRARDTHAWYALLPLASTLLLMFINASCARISTAFDVYKCLMRNRYLKSNGIGIIPDQAIVVEIENARVPTMDLVDLPGLFEAQLDPSSNDECYQTCNCVAV